MFELNNVLEIFIQITSLYVFLKILLKDKIRIFCIKSIIVFICVLLLVLYVFDVNYSGLQTIIYFIIVIIAIKSLCDYSIINSVLIACVYMVALFGAEVINSIIYVCFIDANQLRTKYFILSNITSSILTNLLICLPKSDMLFGKIINVNFQNKKIETMIFSILLIIALSMLFYVISQNYILNKYFITYIISSVIFITLTFIYFNEKYEKEKLIDKYDHLFEYVQTFEDWIDTENINIHESKNQLATLRDMIKGNKKAEKYIDSIIDERINIENTYIENLKPIPKGGLKGLLYYKISVAKRNEIDIEINTSKKISLFLKKFKTETNKDLCRLLGIFFDNAIEAAKDSLNKKIMLEIYMLKDDLCIVISNTFENNIDLLKINQKGFTTKGKNRGKGLYLSQKISKQSKNITLKNDIINNYYVQKITIKKEV